MVKESNDEVFRTEELYNIIKKAPIFGYIDEKNTARRGKEICKKFGEFLESRKKLEMIRETGFMGNGSIIKCPEGGSFSNSDRFLESLKLEEELDENPCMEFYAMLDLIGEINNDCKKYLELRYCNGEKHPDICYKMKKSSREVYKIGMAAHILVAHLTNNTVMIVNSEEKHKENIL